MAVDFALRVWRELIEAGGRGCRIHLSGGEPFGDWQRLISLCRRARRQGLSPLEKVETNAFWAADERMIRDRLTALDEAGMGKLVISADPYHQQYVPIERCRLAARVAEEVLGPDRVQVRWRDWLAEGCDTDRLSPGQRMEMFIHYAARGRDRLIGRAAGVLAPCLPIKPWQELADKPCREALLRSRHVHVDPAGRVMPGTCAGIVLGVVGRDSIATVWRRLSAEHDSRAILSVLAARGPVGLLGMAKDTGFAARTGYASKCHLCWETRRHLVGRGLFDQVLGPRSLYWAEEDAPDP